VNRKVGPPVSYFPLFKGPEMERKRKKEKEREEECGKYVELGNEVDRQKFSLSFNSLFVVASYF
jgi:hypothetical protein